MKLLNNYITENLNHRKFSKISGKYQAGVAFTQIQEKGLKDKKNRNIKGEYHCFQWVKKYYWEAKCLNLEE